MVDFLTAVLNRLAENHSDRSIEIVVVEIRAVSSVLADCIGNSDRISKMLDSGVDLRFFRYAIVSAEYGSFRRAAAALNVQQSSVSKGVRALELRIGVSLFERTYAGVRPTRAGRRFLEEAAIGFDHLEQAMQRISAARRGENGELTVATSVPFFLWGELFKRFHDEYRKVRVEIVSETCDRSVMLLEQRKVDIAFVSVASTRNAMLSLYMHDEQILTVLPKGHRLSTAQVTSLEELRSETFLFSAGGLGPQLAEHLRQNLADERREPSLLFQCVDQCDVVNMVERGLGITLVVGHPRLPVPKGVTLVPLSSHSMLPTYAVWMASNPNPVLQSLLNILLRVSSEQNSLEL